MSPQFADNLHGVGFVNGVRTQLFHGKDTPMTLPKRYARIVAPVAGGAALALTAFAVPAHADAPRVQQAAAVPVCDYAPAERQATVSLIDQRYESEPELQELLGAPVADEVNDDGTYYREYERGQLYWTETTGVHETHGDIHTKYAENGSYEALGAPMTDECSTADGVGQYNHFTGTDDTDGDASIYWHPDTGAVIVYGPVHGHWANAGWEGGTYGYPTTDTAATSDKPGTYNHFTGGDGYGASIYWSPESGAHGVQGSIRDHWGSLGWEDSYLGFPTSDEFDTPAGKRTNFQGGYITWDAATDEVQDFAW